jgi:hypothetical protein
MALQVHRRQSAAGSRPGKENKTPYIMSTPSANNCNTSEENFQGFSVGKMQQKSPEGVKRGRIM